MSQHYTNQYFFPHLSKLKMGEDIPQRTCQALRDLGWIDHNEAVSIKGKLGGARATMMVNFGPGGSCRPGLVTGSEQLPDMIIQVFQWYEEQLKGRAR